MDFFRHSDCATSGYLMSAGAPWLWQRKTRDISSERSLSIVGAPLSWQLWPKAVVDSKSLLRFKWRMPTKACLLPGSAFNRWLSHEMPQLTCCEEGWPGWKWRSLGESPRRVHLPSRPPLLLSNSWSLWHEQLFSSLSFCHVLEPAYHGWKHKPKPSSPSLGYCASVMTYNKTAPVSPDTFTLFGTADLALPETIVYSVPGITPLVFFRLLCLFFLVLTVLTTSSRPLSFDDWGHAVSRETALLTEPVNS